MKLSTHIHLVSGNCWKGFQGQSLEVKVITIPDAIMAEACILIVWWWG